MSELANSMAKYVFLKRYLLTTASVISILGAVLNANEAAADEDGNYQPSVWIELGAQLERVDGGLERFSPPFYSEFKSNQLLSPVELERSSRYSNGGEFGIFFAPEGSAWSFSANVRYGRSQGKHHLHQEYDYPTRPFRVGNNKYFGQYPNVEETATSDRESHSIIDFKIGRDVGLGLFGHGAVSSFALGLRAAAFQASNASTVYARPENHLVDVPLGPFHVFSQEFHNYYATIDIDRNFRGIGPSASWESALPLTGEVRDGRLSFDWGVNGSILFGRQKVVANHQTTALYHHLTAVYHQFLETQSYSHVMHTRRSRSVVVPNVGAFAGVTYRIEAFKLALGYRGDFYFGAMDGGVDTRKTYNRSFYGPFVAISFGLGG